MNDVANLSDPSDISDECEEIIYTSVVDMYNIEWGKTHDIENKATGIVGFVGVVFGLIIASISAIMSAVDPTTKEKIFSSVGLLYFLGFILLLLTASILYGIKALTVKDWSFLEADKFEKYCKYIKPNKNQLYKKMTSQIINNIIENREQNRKIASYLKVSYILFMLSIGLLLVYFVWFLITIR